MVYVATMLNIRERCD